MFGDFSQIFTIENMIIPWWFYPLVFLIYSLTIIAIILTIVIYFLKFQRKTEAERVGFCKKIVIVFLAFMLITFSFFSIFKLIELICIPLNYRELLIDDSPLYLGTLIALVIGFPLFIIGVHAITFFIRSTKSKLKILISLLLYLYVIALFTSILTNLSVYPNFDIGENIDSGMNWRARDSIVTLILGILAIAFVSISFIIVNRKKIIIIEGKNTSYPLKTFSQYFLLILAVMKLACFIFGAIYMENLPDVYNSYGPVILMYSYIAINTLINLAYLGFSIELLHNFRLLNTSAVIEEMNLSKNNSEQKMDEFEDMEITMK